MHSLKTHVSRWCCLQLCMQSAISVTSWALFPHGSVSLARRNLCGCRQRRCNSDEVAGLNWFLIFWICTIRWCLHSAGDFVLRLSHRPKSRVTHKSARIISTGLLLSAECVLIEETPDRFDKSSDQKTALTRTNCLSSSECWLFLC